MSLGRGGGCQEGGLMEYVVGNVKSGRRDTSPIPLRNRLEERR